MPVFAAEPLDLVQISVRRGMTVEFAGSLQELGLTPPESGQVRHTAGRELLWIQPDTYLLTMPRGAPRALDVLAPFASLVDQSAGRSCFTLSGPRARDVLSKGCRLDFHPRVFGSGRVASSSLAHVNAVIQQIDAEPRFRIIVFSSFAQHIAEWLKHASAAA